MKFFKMLTFLIILGLIPSMSFATDLFAPSSSDISITVISQIFGGLVTAATSAGTSTGSDPMLNAIATFNGGILTLGGILAAYTILAGTLGTAHDGEMLGKKFSSVWIPIRYTLGTALVLPIIGGGYCIMQVLVMWLVVQGIGLADSAWSSYMSAPNESTNTVLPTIAKDQVVILAENAFAAAMCVEGEATLQSNSPSILGLPNIHSWQITEGTNSDKLPLWKFGDQSKITFTSATLCGSITGNATSIVPSATAGNSTVSTNTGKLGSLDNLFTSPDISGIATAQNTATQTLINSMDTLAKTIAASPSTVHTSADTYYAQISTASDAYITTVNSAAQSLLSGQTNAYQSMETAASQQGWFMAGAWFMKIIDINQKIHDAINMIPQSQYSFNIQDDEDLVQYTNAAKEVLAIHYGTQLMPTDNGPSKTDTAKAQSNEGNSGGVFAWIGAKMASVFTTIDLYSLKDDSRHPVIIMNEMGNRLVTASVTMLGVISVISLGSGVPFLGGSIAAVSSVISTFLALPYGALIGVGYSASTLIPMMPFVIWLGCLIGWVILVVEAVLAAPLWAVMHLHPNGDDLTGRGANGYMIVLGLLLRPVLMIFGLISAIVLSQILGEFINKVFFQVFEISQGGTISGFGAFFTILFGTVIYCTIMFTFITKMFSIIHIIPDQLMRWIGGGSDNLGQFAGSFEGAAKQSFATAAGGTSAALQGVANGMPKIAGNVSAARTKGKADEEKKLSNASGASSKGAGDAALDKSVGQGSAGTRDNILGHSGSPENLKDAKQRLDERNAYNGGANSATAAGGQAGGQEFESKMQEAAQNGFADTKGDKAEASKNISQGIVNNAVAQRSAQLGATDPSNSAMKSVIDTVGNRPGTTDYSGSNAGRMLGQMETLRSAGVSHAEINNMAQGAMSAGEGQQDPLLRSKAVSNSFSQAFQDKMSSADTYQKTESISSPSSSSSSASAPPSMSETVKAPSASE